MIIFEPSFKISSAYNRMMMLNLIRIMISYAPKNDDSIAAAGSDANTNDEDD